MVQLQYGVDESYRLSVPAPAPGKPAYAYLQVGETKSSPTRFTW